MLRFAIQKAQSVPGSGNGIVIFLIHTIQTSGSLGTLRFLSVHSHKTQNCALANKRRSRQSSAWQTPTPDSASIQGSTGSFVRAFSVIFHNPPCKPVHISAGTDKNSLEI